jgi:hypothetical protein
VNGATAHPLFKWMKEVRVVFFFFLFPHAVLSCVLHSCLSSRWPCGTIGVTQPRAL